MRRIFISLFSILAAASWAVAQSNSGQPLPLAQLQGAAAPPVVITLQDALERARKLDAEVQSAVAEVLSAGEERVLDLTVTNEGTWRHSVNKYLGQKTLRDELRAMLR